MISDPSLLDIVEAGHRLRAKTLTSEALTDACLANIKARNAELRAFITVTGDSARAAARLADRELASGHDRGPLHGIPIALKDLIDQAGVPTTAASHVRPLTPAAARRHRHGAAQGRRRGARRQDQPARVRAGHDERRLGVWRRAQPARHHAVRRRVQRRIGGRAGRRHGAWRHRDRHRRLHPDPFRRLRPGGAQARVRRGARRRRRAVERHARSRRADRAHRRRRRGHSRRAGARHAARAAATSDRAECDWDG